ncbi:MAG: DUF4331 family protein [Chloroflexi bacterium]|nr:DUF4331 family protein [Chloroflexota bacterium]
MQVQVLRSRLSIVVIALVLAVGAVFAITIARGADGADHRDSPGVESDSPADITDVFAFRSPSNNGNLVVAIGVNGLTAPADNATAAFSNDVTYTLHIDTDGDLADDATVDIDFSGDPQTFTITGLGDPIVGDSTPPSTASIAPDPIIAEAGGIKAFAGQRDDAFFFDLVGYSEFVSGPYVPAAGLRTAEAGAPADTFAGTNASYIVLELPITAVTGEATSDTGVIKAWASTSRDGSRVDRMGIPVINTVLIPSDQKDAFNNGSPATDEADFRATGEATIDGLRDAVDAALDGPVGPQDAGPLGDLTSADVAAALIPDIVTIDFSQPVVFPNGRQLEDDVIDVALQLVLNRTVGVTDAIDGNDVSFSSSFPYLAPPHQPAPVDLPPTGGQPGPDDGVASSLYLVLAAAGGITIMAAGGVVLAGRRVRS